MAVLREARINAQEAVDFIFADEDSDEEDIIDEEEEFESSSESEFEDELNDVIGKSGAVVISLIKEFLGCGYNLHVDNWHTSQSLFEYLYEHDAVAAGTARKNQIDLQISFKGKKLEKN